MTTRTRGGFDPFSTGTYSQVVSTQRKNQSPLSTTTTGNNVNLGSTGSVMTDVVTPGYRRLSAQGSIINNPMSRSDVKIEGIPFNGTRNTYTNLRSSINTGDTLSATYTWSNLWINPNYSGFPQMSQPYDFSRLSQDVVNEAFVKSYQQDVMGLVDLAEISKTLELITTNLRRIERMVRGDVRFLYNIQEFKRKRHHKRKATKEGRLSFSYYGKTAMGKAADASNLYLEYKYGVIPTMGTIEGLLKTLVDITKPIRSTYRSNDEKVDKEKAEAIINYSLWGQTKPFYHLVREREVSWDIRAGVITEFRPSINDRLGLSLHNVPAAIYELVPYSFVLDWIWGVGPAIQALIPHPKYRSLASWLTVERQVTDVYTNHFLPQTYTTSTDKMQYFSAMNEARFIEYTKTRTPGVAPGLPNAKINFSHFSHLLNGLALVLSSTKRTSLARL